MLSVGLRCAHEMEFQQVGDRGNGERSLLADTSDVEMLTS